MKPAMLSIKAVYSIAHNGFFFLLCTLMTYIMRYSVKRLWFALCACPFIVHFTWFYFTYSKNAYLEELDGIEDPKSCQFCVNNKNSRICVFECQVFVLIKSNFKPQNIFLY